MPLSLKPLAELCPWLVKALLCEGTAYKESFAIRDLPGRAGHIWAIEDILLVADRVDRQEVDSVFPPHPESLFLSSLIPAAPATNNAFLDIGVGSGVLAITAAKKGWRVTGVDINARALEMAHLNAMINGASVSFEKDDLAQSLLTAGKSFSLCMANLPFEVTPDNCVNFIHSDGGRYGDKLVHRVLEIIPDLLADDGVALVPGFSLIRKDRSRLEDFLAGRGMGVDRAIVRLSTVLEMKLMLFRYEKDGWRRWHSELQRQGYEGFVIELVVLRKSSGVEGKFLGTWLFERADVEWLLPLGGTDLARPFQEGRGVA